MSDQLITHNYDYFDFIHTLLPTALPLKEFYAEYHDLYLKGIALNKQLALLQKFPLKEVPHWLVKGRRFYSRLKTTYRDYNNSPVTSYGQAAGRRNVFKQQVGDPAE